MNLGPSDHFFVNVERIIKLGKTENQFTIIMYRSQKASKLFEFL